MRTFLTLISFFFLTGVFAQPVKPKLIISHLTGDYYVFTTCKFINEKPFPANGMYMVTDEGVVMIDTPWDSTQFQPLLDSIKARHHKNVIMCIATHSHEDRTGGLEFLKQQGIQTYTTKLTDEISRKRNGVRAESLIEKDTTFTIGQHTFQTHYPGKGHTADNIVIWFEKDKILYGGCLVKSTEATDTGNLADANVKEWETTIKKIQKTYPKPNYIIPGHQGWTSTNSLNHTLQLIREYRRSL